MNDHGKRTLAMLAAKQEIRTLANTRDARSTEETANALEDILRSAEIFQSSNRWYLSGYFDGLTLERTDLIHDKLDTIMVLLRDAFKLLQTREEK